MAYKQNEILDYCIKALYDIKTFYKQDFINYLGKTEDTHESYTEVVAKFVCDNIALFNNGIPKITRIKSYKTETHNGKFDESTTRTEEVIAMKMFNQSRNGSDFKYIGKIIDYQTPLKNQRSDVAGKIDLLAYDGETLRVLELKKSDSTETMLRCILEGFTYLKTVDAEKLLFDFNLPKDTKITACPFVFKHGEQYKEMSETGCWLKKTISLLNCKPYYITYENNNYKVEK